MRVMTWPAALLCGMALAFPVAAQEEPVPAEPPPPPPAETTPAATEATPKPKSLEPPLHRWGGWTLLIAAWEPALIGADEEIAMTFEGGRAVPLMAGTEDHIKETIEVTYHLPKDAGMIVGHYDAMSHDGTVEEFTPGRFIYFESRGFPFALGAFDDGFADGVISSATRQTRDFRLEFAKRAFDSRWARGIFKAGYRQVSHDRFIGIGSFAIVPNLPPVIPPVVPDTEDPLRLAPLPDLVLQRSSFSGHGVGAAFDVEFPLHPRFSITSGLSIGVIRGTAKSTFESTSSYYFQNANPDVPLTQEELFDILGTGTEAEILEVNQAVVTAALSQPPSDQIAVSYDVYFGIEGTVYRGLKLFARLRNLYYSNVGEYVVPTSTGSNDRTSLNAGYEGYNLGLSWRF